MIDQEEICRAIDRINKENKDIMIWLEQKEY